MNVAIVRGRLSSPPRTHQLPSGDVLTALEVTVPAADGEPASSVPIAWFGAPAASADWPPGFEVLVVGRVRRRWFRAGATTQSRTELVADRVVPATRRAAAARALAEVTGRLEPGL
jgi:single-strand DNA-binding protein